MEGALAREGLSTPPPFGHPPLTTFEHVPAKRPGPGRLRFANLKEFISDKLILTSNKKPSDNNK